MNYLEFPDGSLFWQQSTYLRGINMSSIRLTTRMKEEIARNALIKSGVFTELEEVTKLKNQLALDARVIAFGGKKKTEEVDQLSSKLVAISEELEKMGCSFYSYDG